MFVLGEPLEVKTAANVFGVDKGTAREYFRELQREYEEEGRGLAVREIGGGFQFVTRAENFEHVRRLCTPAREKKLSMAALETLAIVAYKQPVTRGEIEMIRGIKCDRMLEGLLKRDLIEETGRADSAGRPILYGTTKMFLRYFGFAGLNELPEIEDIERSVREPDESGGVRQFAIDLEGQV
jgi:segregation and condensation protein B